jgi:hypothetical protein
MAPLPVATLILLCGISNSSCKTLNQAYLRAAGGAGSDQAIGQLVDLVKQNSENTLPEAKKYVNGKLEDRVIGEDIPRKNSLKKSRAALEFLLENLWKIAGQSSNPDQEMFELNGKNQSAKAWYSEARDLLQRVDQASLNVCPRRWGTFGSKGANGTWGTNELTLNSWRLEDCGNANSWKISSELNGEESNEVTSACADAKINVSNFKITAVSLAVRRRDARVDCQQAMVQKTGMDEGLKRVGHEWPEMK